MKDSKDLVAKEIIPVSSGGGNVRVKKNWGKTKIKKEYLIGRLSFSSIEQKRIRYWNG